MSINSPFTLDLNTTVSSTRQNNTTLRLNNTDTTQNNTVTASTNLNNWLDRTTHNTTTTTISSRSSTDLIPGPSTSRNSFGSTSQNNVSLPLPEDIMCLCNQPAVQLTVRKEGPNKGKKFYKCTKGKENGGCDLFLWAPETNNTTIVDNNNRADPSLLIKCNCNQAATLRTVVKEGRNKGRQFYSCSKPIGQSCSFFKWADEVNKYKSVLFESFNFIILDYRCISWWWR